MRREALAFRSLIASDAEIVAIWRRGLAGGVDLDISESDRFELLMINSITMLRAQFDAHRRDLFATEGTAFWQTIAGTRGFRSFWTRRHVSGDTEFDAYIEALASGRQAPTGQRDAS